MSYFAYVSKIENGKGIVEQVIRISAEELETGNWGNPFDWIQTSYNTYGGVHVNGGTPLRKNYAGIGFIYDANLDAFMPPKPYPSWLLNENTCLWNAPVLKPNDGKSYIWDEPSLSWKEFVAA